MNVLLSIKPKYVELIKAGTKKYEFRRKIFKKSGDCRVFIYASSPIKKIVGSFVPSTIHEGLPPKIWGLFGKDSGLSKEEFLQYFNDSETAFAIEIQNLLIFDHPWEPSDLFLNFTAPQSYVYFNLKQKLLPCARSTGDK